MHIAVASHDVFWPVRGGGGVRVYWVTRALLERGHRITVIAPFLHRRDLDKPFPGIRIWSIGRITRFSAHKELRYAVLMARTFIRLMRIRADVFYAQNVVAALPAVCAGRLRHVPVVFDMIDLLTGYSRNAAARRIGAVLETWVLKRADAVAVTSRNLMQLARDCGSKNTEQVRHGVDLETFFPRRSRRDTVAFVGGIEANDGVDLIPRAAQAVLKEFPRIRFLFVGEGKALPGLVRQVRVSGMKDRFEFRKWVDQSKLPGILARALVGLVTSYRSPGTDYAYPLRSIEYMAMGVPFVASDLEGVREQAERSRGGLLFESGNAEALAEALLRILRDPGLARRLGQNGRSWALEHADWKTNAARVADLCESVVR